MSWKALDWATGLDIDSAIAKFILHLLANKADENKKLEVDGLITRNPQFHDSGAQRANRYYLNHPLAPHPA